MQTANQPTTRRLRITATAYQPTTMSIPRNPSWSTMMTLRLTPSIMMKPSDHIYDDDPPFEPVHYPDTTVYYDDNTHLELAHFDNVASTWSSPLPPTLYEAIDELELEVYTDATANRSYTEDEIHPAYHDNPVHCPRAGPGPVGPRSARVRPGF